MVRDENYVPPFDSEEATFATTSAESSFDGFAAVVDQDALDELEDDDLNSAQAAWNGRSSQEADDVAEQPAAVAASPGEGDQSERLATAFVGRWNELVSSTNWQKGLIIQQWRTALMQSGAPQTEYSDETWARRVGGVTASHVGRLRRVYEAFSESHQSYHGLYWTHFLVALDWDDAPLWLEGAAQSSWSVSAMRQQRWQAYGGDEASRPHDGDVATDLDEDFDTAAASFTQPGQGGGSTKNYEDGPNAIGSGPAVEGPDFGDEESLNRAGDDFAGPMPESSGKDAEEAAMPLVQPFAGLPELPSDLADAVELLKLALLRHKTAGWKEISADAVAKYLQAFSILIEARGK